MPTVERVVIRVKPMRMQRWKISGDPHGSPTKWGTGTAENEVIDFCAGSSRHPESGVVSNL